MVAIASTLHSLILHLRYGFDCHRLDGRLHRLYSVARLSRHVGTQADTFMDTFLCPFVVHSAMKGHQRTRFGDEPVVADLLEQFVRHATGLLPRE
jgi:hypothetical protein